ncbi:hypothetical protein [Brevundimonas sp. FT23028]|uniref:hypothetical protein n=1 Tax=Brevundimonas sp. FT23028 TaxID=3393748 RepID=UPI003B587112
MKISSDSLTSLLAPLKASAEARADRLQAGSDAKLRNARAASEALKTRSDEASESRKAAARQTIERLKARLQMLRSMAGMDPEGVARLAAQLARELGAAVKAYASAGGNTAGMSASGAAPVASGDAAAAASADAQAQAGQAQTQATDAVASGGAPSDSEAGAGEEAKSANPYQQAINEQKSQAAEMSRRNGEKRADSELMADVRRMAAELKGMIRRATEQAKAGEDGSLSPHEARELDDAAADLDKAIRQAGTDLGGGLVSLII